MRTFLALLLLSSSAVAQTKTSKPLADCRTDNEALRSDLARLREEVESLRKKLAGVEESKVAAADAPFRDAVASLRAVDSVITAGSYLDFKKYFLDAKVKVDSLSPGERTNHLHAVLDIYADAGIAWNSYVTNRQMLYRRDMEQVFSRNQGLEGASRVLIDGGPSAFGRQFTSYQLNSVISFLAESARSKLATITP